MRLIYKTLLILSILLLNYETQSKIPTNCHQSGLRAYVRAHEQAQGMHSYLFLKT